MKRLLLAIALMGCTPSDETAQRVLEDAGYTAVRLEGFGWWGCAKDDKTNMRFRAHGPTGRQVSGILCWGMFLKGCTVRLD
jgi:hypothetical protein